MTNLDTIVPLSRVETRYDIANRDLTRMVECVDETLFYQESVNVSFFSAEFIGLREMDSFEVPTTTNLDIG